MNTHYTAITFISAFAMLLMIFCAQTNQFLAPYRKRCFQVLFALIMVTDIAEWLAVWLGTGPVEWHTLRTAVKFVELTFTPCVPFVCMRAISGARTAAWKTLPVAFNVVLQIVSLFTGWVFAVDAANQYTRGPLYLLYMSTFLIEAVLLMVHCVLFSKRYQYANMAFLVLINTLVAVAALGELYLSTLRLDWVCVSYAVIMFYIYYGQLVQQVDPLTSLLNRRSFDCAMHRVRGRVAVIFFDVDHFKAINDTHGHKFGDQCLVSVAQDIRAVFEKNGYCYRYGGDEFCVILRREHLNVEALISSYITRIRTLRKKEPRMPFVSVGYAQYDPETECIDDAVHRADEMMYLFKEKHRTERASV